MRYAPDRNAPTFLAPANESARHSPKKGIFVRVSEAGENYLEHAGASNPVMPERKKNHAKADRAWPGLRAPLRFGRLLDETDHERAMRSMTPEIAAPYFPLTHSR